MSALIKSTNAADLSIVRSLASGSALLSIGEQERERLRARIASLEEELRRREAAVVDLHGKVKQAFEDGKAEGRKLGCADADKRESERLSVLQAATEQAQAELRNNLSSMERLAALLARDCLDIMLGEPKYRAKMLAKLLAAQMAKLEKSLVLGVRFSTEDFPDAEVLSGVAAQSGLPPEMITASAELASGGCEMTLRLGRMEIGVERQWNFLRGVLEEMAQPGETP
jgi:flagellar biosynthesis/type III secretory pathway protein FliH